MTGDATVFGDYVGSLERLAAHDAEKTAGLEAIEREFQEAGSRLQREHAATEQQLALLRDRVGGFAVKVRHFAQSLGATATPGAGGANVPVERLSAHLEALAARLKKAEDARDWVARFAQSESARSSQEAEGRERERHAQEAREREASSVRAAQLAAQQSTDADSARARRRRLIRTVYLVAGGAVVLLAVVTLIVINSR